MVCARILHTLSLSLLSLFLTINWITSNAIIRLLKPKSEKEPCSRWHRPILTNFTFTKLPISISSLQITLWAVHMYPLPAGNVLFCSLPQQFVMIIMFVSSPRPSTAAAERYRAVCTKTAAHSFFSIASGLFYTSTHMNSTIL